MPETKRKKSTAQKAGSFLSPLAGIMAGSSAPPLASPFLTVLVDNMIQSLLGRSSGQEPQSSPYPFAMEEFQPVRPFPIEEVPFIPTAPAPMAMPARRSAAPRQAEEAPSPLGRAIPRFGPTGASQDFGSPIPNVPLETNISGSDRVVGTLRNNAGTLLPILGLLGLAALAGRDNKKQQKPAGRTAQAGSLERGQTLTIPKDTTMPQRLLAAAPDVIGAYMGIQEQKKAQAQAAAKRQQDVALTIAKGMSEGWMTTEMADALGSSVGIPGASQLGAINPLEMQRILSRTTPAGAAALGIELPQKEDTSDADMARRVASDLRQPKSTRDPAVKFLANPGPETRAAFLKSLGTAAQRVPVSGTGSKAAGATVGQQINTAIHWGFYIPGILSEKDPAMVSALTVGRDPSYTEEQRLKIASSLSGINEKLVMATGKGIPGAPERVRALVEPSLGGSSTAGPATSGSQRTQAEYAAMAASIRKQGATKADIPDLLEKLRALQFDPNNPTLQAAFQSLPED